MFQLWSLGQIIVVLVLNDIYMSESKKYYVKNSQLYVVQLNKISYYLSLL